MRNARSTQGGAAGALVAVAAMLAACGGQPVRSTAAASSPGGTCQGSSGNASATTANYVIVLDVGPPEQMYSQQQVQSDHPTSGEVMLGGAMTDVSGPNVRHMEAHVCNRNSGAVVTGAQPVITLTDTTAGTAAKNVPVAEMEGIGEGTTDYHYGNNVVLQPGHTFTVTVRLNGESAVMQYKPT
jgi:hypothetical protein